MRVPGEHDSDCDIYVSNHATHEHVWNHDFLRQRCVNMLQSMKPQDSRDTVIVALRTMDAFGYNNYLEYPQEQRDAFAAILLAKEVFRAYWYADDCHAMRNGTALRVRASERWAP